jgi:hypothetical protein
VSGTGPGPLPHTRRLGQAGGAGTAVTVPWCASPSRHDVTRVPFPRQRPPVRREGLARSVLSGWPSRAVAHDHRHRPIAHGFRAGRAAHDVAHQAASPRPRRTTTPSRPTRRRTRLVSARVRLPVAKRPRAGAGPTILSAVRRVVRGCV